MRPGSVVLLPEVARSPDPADIVGALQTAIIVVDPDMRIVSVNAAAEAAINISASHLIGRLISEILSLPVGFDASGEGPFAAYDIDLSTRRGHHLHGDFVVSPLADWPGWRLIALQNAAAAYRIGHRVDRTSGARSATGVAAMLAHEIKNPLSGIRGAAQLVGSRAAPDDRRMTDLICSEVDRITNLVDQMEGFTDTRRLTSQPDNIYEIIDHARRIAESGFGAQLRIVESYDPSLPMVLVHRDSLVQILINLLKNAAETAGPEELRTVRITTAYRHGVSLTADQDGRKRALPIELCIVDDGPGAPADLADVLFDPFVSSKRSGRGLGLALADKLMRDMGGIIQYERAGTPQMTIFRLLLPRAERRMT
jgi:two-component system, NtrC family, nitrogen regulation sensor histidine kinase GlnL